METNLIDLIFIFTVVVSGSLALYQGFFKELLALFGWVIAFVNIKIFFSSLSNSLKTIIENDLIRDIIIISFVFIFTLIVWRLLSIPILKIFKSTSIGYLDKFLGFVFGIFRVFFLTCIIFIYTILPNEKDNYPNYLKESNILPIIENFSIFLVNNFEFLNTEMMQVIIENEKENEIPEVE